MTARDPILVHAVSWVSGEPRLLVSNPLTDERTSLPLIGERLAFTVDAAGRFCTGVFVAHSADDGRHEPCDGHRLATTNGQCERCAARDASRFMHHAHRGGYVPESLDRHLAQPHWLYVATFADGASKVGTASDARKRVRLDEQGAVRATYVARICDGRSVRVLEDAVTERAGIPQTKHKTSKAAALTRAASPASLEASHADAVAQAAQAIIDMPGERPHEPWRPPPPHVAFFAHTRVHPLYPHPLDTGEHCLTPEAVVGGIALARVNDDDELVLVDLDRLRGRRLTLGGVRSPVTSTQHSLF